MRNHAFNTGSGRSATYTVKPPNRGRGGEKCLNPHDRNLSFPSLQLRFFFILLFEFLTFFCLTKTEDAAKFILINYQILVALIIYETFVNIILQRLLKKRWAR